jgi:hypothetical protein
MELANATYLAASGRWASAAISMSDANTLLVATTNINGGAPSSMTVEGSNDGSVWTQLSTLTAPTAGPSFVQGSVSVLTAYARVTVTASTALVFAMSANPARS